MTLHSNAQIAFREIAFEEAKKLAKQEEKLIFLDAYTTWCVPCKWMDGNVFNQSEVGEYYNSQFINVKFDCEKGEGIDIAKEYGVKSFPTYLFIDGDGELIYKALSKMEVSEFMEQGKRANTQDYQIPFLRSEFQAGNRHADFLLRYILVMNNIDPQEAEQGRKALSEVADDSFLKSAEGWEVIKMMARSNQDRYGRFFQLHKDYFKSIAKPEEFIQKESQLIRYSMYGYLRSGDKDQFDAGIAYFSKLEGEDAQVDVALYRAEWAGTHGTDQEFIKVTNELRKGVLKDNDQRLSFIARRFAREEDNAKSQKLKQCYVLAKQATELNPDDYSNQGTLAEICIQLNKKKEAVKAAQAARALAELETSKIVDNAQKLLDRANSL